MNKKEITMGRRNLRFLFYRYKDSPYYSVGIICITIFVSILLIFNIIIPQVNSWFSVRKEIEETEGRINIIKNNINTMTSVDKDELENHLQVAISALPSEKNFASIISVMSESSLRADISLEDYTFQVGNIASFSAQKGNKSTKGLSIVKITVTLAGSIQGVKNFLKEVENKLPLAEVTKFDYDTTAAIVSIQFYQKPLPRFSFNDTDTISTITPKKAELIRKLSDWQVDPSVQNISSGSSSSAAMPLF